MPVYTYHCENCGVRFERLQGFNDPQLSYCPECSKKTLRKVYTPVGIVFKGSGFYSTDHRSASGSFNRSPKDAETDTGKKDEAANSSSEKSNPEKSSGETAEIKNNKDAE